MVAMMTAPQTTLPTHHSPGWLAAVQRASDLAHAKFADIHHGRIERGCALALTGGVWVEETGATLVRASDGATWYRVNGHCPCDDLQAPEHKCKHWWAKQLYRRAGDLLRAGLPQPAAAPEAAPHSPAAGALPEAAFSLTLEGRLQGHKVLLTARGQCWDEFQRNVERLRGLLDPASPPPAAQDPAPAAQGQPTPEGWCLIHQKQMEKQTNERGAWWSHKHDGEWCKGKRKGA